MPSGCMTNARTHTGCPPEARTASCSPPELVQEFAYDRIKLGAPIKAVEANAQTPSASPNINAASVQIVYDPWLKIAVDADAGAVPVGIARRGWMDADRR